MHYNAWTCLNHPEYTVHTEAPREGISVAIESTYRFYQPRVPGGVVQKQWSSVIDVLSNPVTAVP